MTKRISSFALALPPRTPDRPIGRWLYGAIRASILEGRLRPGARLPSSRDLARHYGLARGTVVGAYEALTEEGYLEARVGAGTRVSRILPDSLLSMSSPAAIRAPPTGPRPRPALSGFARRLRPLSGLSGEPVRAFRANQPALELFPTPLWSQIAGRTLRRAGRDLLLGCDPLGYRPLRRAISDYLTTSRGVRCSTEQVAIVSGVQEALDLSARLLLEPGDRVAIEDPGYDGATLYFEAFGATVTRPPVDREGLAVDDPALEDARLVYVTPAHQFPLGVGMSLARRLALLGWARETGATIFEDDYDSEYRYAGRPMPALQGLDRDDRVLLAGSFSKTLFPALRLGYLVLPEDLVDPFSALLSIARRHPPLLEQAVLADFIASGHFGRHLRRMREVYAGRLGALLDAARERLGGLLEISGVEAGLQTVGWLRCGLDGARAAAAAARSGVEVVPLGRYGGAGLARDALHLGFAAVSRRQIRRGVQELAAALEDELTRSPQP